MNKPMTPRELENEFALQAKADQREAAHSPEHDDPSIDKYRLVNRIVKKADMPALPANFVARVMQQVQDYEERAQFENAALRILVVVTVMAGLLFSLPLMFEAIQKISSSVALPWPMLWATTLAIGFAAVIDTASRRYRATHG